MTDDTSPSNLLTQQLNQLKTLSALLNQEIEVLQHHDPEALIVITSKKNDLLLAIQTLDTHIGQDPLFVSEKPKGSFNNILEEISTTLEQCQQQNHINGQVVMHSQLAVERMKTSLLENHNKNSMTYDSKGKKSGGLSSIGIKA